jgi:endo-1,4-beta-xylanase
MVHAQLARSLLDAGVPIDGVGFQCHFIGGSVPEDLAETMAMFTDMGLEVPLTELDVRVPVNNRGIANSTWLDIQSVYPHSVSQMELTGQGSGLRKCRSSLSR